MGVLEKEKLVSLWSIEQCEETIKEIKKRRGNDQRVWAAGTAETYWVVMRRLRLLSSSAQEAA